MTLLMGTSLPPLLLGFSMLHAIAIEVPGEGVGAALKPEPLGCYNYGYVFSPTMESVDHMPFRLNSAMTCQARCRATPGCKSFNFWRRTQECWLAGSSASLIYTDKLGVVSGPDTCAESGDPACVAIPGPNFPGATEEESRSAWPEGQQPTNLQCWPRERSGFPSRCKSHPATVLEDTAAGWPGRCQGLKKVASLGELETCQLRCMQSPLCGVWMLENETSGDGGISCWIGMSGKNCYSGTGPRPLRAQRIMHGSYRVLMNAVGMKIRHLAQTFDAVDFPAWKDGAKKCRMICLSYILCQFWQYSDVYGCLIEDVQTGRITYPLARGPEGVLMAADSDLANSVKAGEYIQHLCPDGAAAPLPTDDPSAWDKFPTPPPSTVPPPTLPPLTTQTTQSPKQVRPQVDTNSSKSEAQHTSAIKAHEDAVKVRVLDQKEHQQRSIGGWGLGPKTAVGSLCMLGLSIVGVVGWVQVVKHKRRSKRIARGISENLDDDNLSPYESSPTFQPSGMSSSFDQVPLMCPPQQAFQGAPGAQWPPMYPPMQPPMHPGMHPLMPHQAPMPPDQCFAQPPGYIPTPTPVNPHAAPHTHGPYMSGVMQAPVGW